MAYNVRTGSEGDFLNMALHPARARVRALASSLALAAAGCLVALAGAPAIAGAGAAATLDPQERAVCTQINAYRATKGLAPLRVSPSLTRAAEWMSADMAANDYLDHTDSRGRDTVARVRSFGFRGATIGENLAGGDGDAAATFAMWKAEPAHRRGMLRSSLRLIGVARASGADTMLGWYWTTTFGAGRERGAAC
jgi:uncharacterized protein YkwD